MPVNGLNSSLDIAVSGLRAQTMKMNVISTNIANAHTTRTDSGEPYRRQIVALSTNGDGIGGVQIDDVLADTETDFQAVMDKGNPDANEEGYVMMPNVQVPVEMMNLVTASRAYQANAAVLKRYQDSIEITLELLR
jgi:flagellar basal-body rod protein FlgC